MPVEPVQSFAKVAVAVDTVEVGAMTVAVPPAALERLAAALNRIPDVVPDVGRRERLSVVPIGHRIGCAVTHRQIILSVKTLSHNHRLCI